VVRADESGEGRNTWNLHCPPAKTVIAKMRFNPVRRRIAFIASEQLGEMLHHSRIGVHRGEIRAILVSPWPQQ
jgi:hypothetical protein